jgi:hypothetical protein
VHELLDAEHAQVVAPVVDADQRVEAVGGRGHGVPSPDRRGVDREPTTLSSNVWAVCLSGMAPASPSGSAAHGSAGRPSR